MKITLPKTLKHKETISLMKGIMKKLGDTIDVSDVPQLHRMATAYDTYLDCVDYISENGPTTVNLKGEEVKHPMANLLRESWSQYLELAKEYGLTAKSRGQIKSLSTDEAKSPLEEFLKK